MFLVRTNDIYLIPLLLCTLTVAVYFDVRTSKIPNLLTYPAMAAGLFYQGFCYGWGGLVFGTEGLLLGIGLLVLPYAMGGMGAGDAKLLGATGAMLGPKGALISCLLSALAGGIYALILIIVYREKFRKSVADVFARYQTTLKALILSRQLIYIHPQKTENSFKLRYGVAIASGTVAYVVSTWAGCGLVL